MPRGHASSDRLVLIGVVVTSVGGFVLLNLYLHCGVRVGWLEAIVPRLGSARRTGQRAATLIVDGDTPKRGCLVISPHAMRLIDSRRLRGPSLGTRVPAAVAEVALDGVDSDRALASWHRWVRAAAEAVKRPELGKGAHARIFLGGLALLIPAPIDVLLPAADLNEWAIEAARRELLGRRVVLSRDAGRRLRRRFHDAEHPSLLALEAAARAHGAPFLWDDDEVTLGLGKHARSFEMDALPSPASIDWESVGRIPVALVTGTNGKTTTTRWVARMAKHAGLLPGNSSTDGVTIDERIEEAGDWTGAEAARRVLRDPRVELAILETARGGILRRGLALDGYDAALITHVDADHLGEFGVYDVDTMAATKAVVGHAVSAKGKVVVPADDERLALHWPQWAAEPVLFCEDPSHPRISAQLAEGRHAFVVSDGRIVHRSLGAEVPLIALTEVPLTFGGLARHNVKNALAACALAWSLGIDRKAVIQGLRSFGQNTSDNPGRGELHALPSGARLLLDFGHNPAALTDLLSLARSLSKGRCVLVTTLAGDRTDDAHAAYARALRAAGADRVVVWETESLLRGRPTGGTVATLSSALSAAGYGEDDIDTGDGEIDAIRRAAASANDADVIVATPHMARMPIAELLAALGSQT
jgi:UDP-N-acetylmuramyl tripeptide synthase